MSRILLHTFGSLGDLHPYLAIGRALIARGHDVVIATHPDYRSRVEAAGLRFHGVPPALGEFANLPAVFREAMHPRDGSRFVLMELCLPFVRPATLALLEAAQGAQLVVGHPLGFGAVLAAEKLGLPRAHVMLQPVTTFSRLDPPYLDNLPLLAWLLGRSPGRWAAAYALASFASRGAFEPVRRLRAELGLPLDRRHPLFEMASPTLNLALFSHVLMEPQPDWPPHTIATGFAFHDRDETGGGMPAGLDAFLAAGSAPLVFTLGSSAVFDAGRFYEESLGAARALGLRAVLLCGPDGRNRPVALGPDVFVADYAPHSDVFPRAAAVVHQGGIGTTGQALAAGRPMLVMPVSHDQPDNAARCRRLGLARVLGRRDYRADRVAFELRALLGDSGAARRAAEIGAVVRAEDGAAVAATALERACLPANR